MQRQIFTKTGILAFATVLTLGSPLTSTFVVSAGAAQPCSKAAALEGPSDDRRTSEEIRRRIAADDTVSPLARQVVVTTTEGVVTLRGPVGSAEERLVLASLAESAPGVRRVDDRLEVRP